MIPDRKLPELKLYRGIETSFPLGSCPALGRLVVATSNENSPVHRWFRFKEGFSSDLLATVVRTLTPDLGGQIRLLDPFCGVGTTLLAAQELAAEGLSISAIGIERNPFIAFVARTKVNWAGVVNLPELGREALERAKELSPALPVLSSIREGRCISQYMARRIVAVREAIRSHGCDSSHDGLLLGLAASVESVSRVRKDGRALRIVERDRTSLARALAGKWSMFAADVEARRTLLHAPLVSQVVIGDGRNPSSAGVLPNSIDLILTSPPYPNNIDYNEVYKLELWLLGFVSDGEDFLRLRYSSFRSHPTCTAPDMPEEFERELKRGALKQLLGPLLTKAEASPKRWRTRMLRGYFSDFWMALREHYRCLRSGGYEVLVVGNSLHGGPDCPYLIPTDLAVSAMARCLGFSVEKTLVARALKRRLTGNHFLRESLIVLKRP